MEEELVEEEVVEQEEKKETTTPTINYIAVIKIPKIGLEKGLASKGSYWNNVNRNIEILEDGEIVKATMVNEKVVVEVPNTGLNDYFVLEIISGLLILSGIGVIIYAKKKNKK